MKMPEEHLDVNMFAPCGMNCKVCYKHCYHKTPCAGCFNSDKGKPEHCRTCKIKDCILCEECYAGHSRATPLLNPLECLQKHTQYICGTCGRCICIERDGTRGLQRWNFPFKSLDIAKLYLRTADYTNKKSCGIYEIKSSNGRISYKIFPDEADLQQFLKKNKEKTCEKMAPVFTAGAYTEYPDTQVRRLTSEEIERYLSER